MKSTLLACAVFVLATSAIGADVTGKWKGSFQGGDDTHEVTFNLKADGNKLTGDVSGLLDKALEIQEGKIQGSTITFSVMSEWQGNPIKLVYKGDVASDEIHFTMGTDDGSWSTEFTAKRVSG